MIGVLTGFKYGWLFTWGRTMNRFCVLVADISFYALPLFFMQ